METAPVDRTVTSTVSVSVTASTVTVSENVRVVVADTSGAVKLGAAVSDARRVTVGPCVWLHE